MTKDEDLDDLSKVDAATRLAVQAYAWKLLRTWGTFFGALNVAALVGVFFWVHFVVADMATQRVMNDSKLQETVRDALATLHASRDKAEALADGVDDLRGRVGQLHANLHALSESNVVKVGGLVDGLVKNLGANANVETILIAAQKRWKLECREVERRSAASNDMPVLATDASFQRDGYQLISGGCRYDDVRDEDRTLTLTSAPARDGWQCWYKNPRATTVTAVSEVLPHHSGWLVVVPAASGCAARASIVRSWRASPQAASESRCWPT